MKYSYVLILTVLLACGASSLAQTTTGTLRGQVTDPSGAVVTNATVSVRAPGGHTLSATTNRGGAYEIGNLAPGRYAVTANAKGFAVFAEDGVEVAAGQVAQFNIALEISVEKERVNVQEETPQVDVNPASNASAIVLSGKDLEALPDDPDELQSDLEALAGPSAGPNGGQMYIDGFTAGQLPPKSSIREIRVNQNPFSAEYDKLGYGRIEIFTKPGTDKLHGQFAVEGNSSGMNSRNPFLGTAPQAPYDSVEYMGNIGGPISKKASFFFNVQRRNIDEIAVLNAPALGLSESVPNPRTRTNIGPRIDYQVSPNNTLTARYQFYRNTQENAGVGGTVLPEAGYDNTSTEHTVQISDTQILGTKAVNETRFQYLRDNSGQTPVSTAVGINVLGDFTKGGASSGTQTDRQDHYELQNYTSISAGKHFVKFGGRLRAIHEISLSSAGFNGTYTFTSFQNYTTGIPSQYSINATPSGGAASVPVTLVDAGLYVQDDWKVRPTFTLSGGLRYETQNAIHDHADWAPRLGFAWGIGGGGKHAENRAARRFRPILRPVRPGPGPQFGPSERRDTATVRRVRSALSKPATGGHVAADDTGDLPDQFWTTGALHHADRLQPGASGDEDRKCYGFVSECARRAPTAVRERQRPAAGDTVLVGAASQPGGGPHLPIRFGWSFPAEPVDRELQYPGGRETEPVRLLLSERRE